eukprot:SAG11_NODE_52_length_19809_cov_14.064231_7_plen_248_part_00
MPHHPPALGCFSAASLSLLRDGLSSARRRTPPSRRARSVGAVINSQQALTLSLSLADDKVNFGATEGSVWVGNFWTQNSYGVGFASLPFLPQPQRQWMQTSFLWWFDHMGDGGQTFGGMPDTPDGMLCDNGNPGGCNYMQCGAGRRRLEAERGAEPAAPEQSYPSKRRDTHKKWEATQDFAAAAAEEIPTLEAMAKLRADDTPGLGHDWVIGGTLAGGVMQAEVSCTVSTSTSPLPLTRHVVHRCCW